MTIFELSWSHHEDYIPYLFAHENKTEEEFKNDVRSLMVKYIDEFLVKKEEENDYAGSQDFVAFIVEKMSELGYIPITPVKLSFWGERIVNGKYGRKENSDICMFLGENIYQKFIDFNKKIKEKGNSDENL